MGWNYRKSINLGGGVRMNFSKSGVSYSWGVKGFRVCSGPKGTRITNSIPGTGIYHTQTIPKRTSTQSTATRSAPALNYTRTVTNAYTGESRLLRATSEWELSNMVRAEEARQQANEARQRRIEQTQAGENRAKELTAEEVQLRKEYSSLIAATLAVDDTLDWDAQYNRTPYPAFQYNAASGQTRSEALKGYVQKKNEYEYARLEQNSNIDFFRQQYEQGEQTAVEKYVLMVLGNSKYPGGLDVDYDVQYSCPQKELTVQLLLPDISTFPFAKSYKYNSNSQEYEATPLPENVQKNFYQTTLWAIMIRTASEIFEADHIDAVDMLHIDGLLENEEDDQNVVMSIDFDRKTFVALSISDSNIKDTIDHFQHSSIL